MHGIKIAIDAAMRLSRVLQLSQSGGMVHKFWRAHNKAYLLNQDTDKQSYLKHTFLALAHKSAQKQVSLHSYCVMDNHSHQLLSYKGSSRFLSIFMRIAHSRFGQAFNRRYARQGAVAYDRPKTPLIQNDHYHQMQVQFYIEANPLRAKMIKNLKMYKYSSFRFYAWGIADEFSSALEIPEWYLRLGTTSKKRQSEYRRFFNSYLKQILERSALFTKSRYIGNPSWVMAQRKALKKALSSRKSSKPPDTG